MLNRWWSVSETCGEANPTQYIGVEDVEQCCATSRHIIYGSTLLRRLCHFVACQQLSIVCHLRWRYFATASQHLREISL